MTWLSLLFIAVMHQKRRGLRFPFSATQRLGGVDSDWKTHLCQHEPPSWRIPTRPGRLCARSSRVALPRHERWVSFGIVCVHPPTPTPTNPHIHTHTHTDVIGLCVFTHQQIHPCASATVTGCLHIYFIYLLLSLSSSPSFCDKPKCLERKPKYKCGFLGNSASWRVKKKKANAEMDTYDTSAVACNFYRFKSDLLKSKIKITKLISTAVQEKYIWNKLTQGEFDTSVDMSFVNPWCHLLQFINCLWVDDRVNDASPWLKLLSSTFPLYLHFKKTQLVDVSDNKMALFLRRKNRLSVRVAAPPPNSWIKSLY